MLRHLSRQIWLSWERLFHWAGRLQSLQAGERHLFFIATRRYLGRKFVVGNVTVRPFDKVIELHMNNDLLAEVLRTESQAIAIAVKLLHEAQRSFPVLAKAVNQNGYASAKAIYGVTFIHRGIRKLGFESFPMRSKLARAVTRWHLKNVFRMVNPDAENILKTHSQVFEPMIVAASKEHFVSLYLTHKKTQEENMNMVDHCLT